MLPSNINNAFRDIMADIRQHYNTAEWIEYGDGAGTYTPTYASSTSFTIDGVNVTAIYHVGRRVKVVASTPGTIYGSITAVAFSTNTTVTISWDSGSLSDEAITSVYIGALANTNKSIPIASIATANIADDAVTAAKMAANSVDSDSYVDGSIDLAHMSVNSIDSDQYVDASIDTAHLAADVITAAKIADDAIDSEHYTDGSIDTAHIAADQITNAKIADDQIDSEHYVDASIDLAHLAASSVNSSKIVDDSIVNADINSSAAIDATKIANGTVTSAEFQYINTLSSNAQTQINAKAATTYVDNAVAGLRTRIIAECASTANVNVSNGLEAGDAIDGITLVAGDRVLLKDQSTASENGLYTAVGSGAGAASRDTQFNSIAELSGQMVVVNQGSANDNKIFLCTTNNTASLGSDSITFTVITPSNSGTVTSIVAGTGLTGGTITAAGTIAIDSTVATLAGTQTLTNKTLTSPKINEDVAVTSTATELNLLDGVSGLVQADLTKLAAVDSTAAELNTLDALSRGSILYGNASAATTVLTKGTSSQVLTSDGTDISWADPSDVGDNAVTLAKMAAGTDGNLISYDASGDPVAVATGNDGQVLTSTGAGSPPVFEALPDSGITWQTIVTGSTLTAVAGRGYWINTTSNACTITLPSSASNGDQIILADYARTWGTNKIIIDSNGLKYQGNDDSYTVEYSTSGETVNIVYSGATNGWIPLDDDSVADVGVAPATQRAIFAFGSINGGARTGISNLVNSSGVVASDVSAVGTASEARMAATYGGDKAIFAYGNGSGSAIVSFSNLVNNSGVIASDTTGVGMARGYVGGTEYGGDKALAAFGNASDDDGGQTSISNKISNSGVVASNTTGVGQARAYLAGVRYGVGKGIFGFGNATGVGITGVTNLVSDTGTVATDTSAVGTACEYVGATAYGGDKGVFGFGRLAGGRTAKTNKVSNTGVVASDTSGVGTVRQYVSGTNYGADKGIFGFGNTADGITNGTGITNLVNTSGVVASDTSAVGTARWYTTGAGYSFSA
jgi:hypothetical protein